MNLNLITKIKNNKKYFYTFLILFFIFLSFLALSPFWITGHLYSGADLQFHTSRIQEMVENIKQGVLIPGIATHTFNQVGDMVTTAYPWITLYPFALLMFIFKPVNAIYSGMALYIFTTLLIAYYSMHLVSHSRKISFYFAILYGYTSFFIFNMLNIEFGTFLSYVFFPLAIVGFYLIMFKNYKKWYLLTIGTIGILYSHTPSALILICTLIILFLSFIAFQKKGERLKRFFYLLIANISTLLLSLIVWGNIIILLFNQQIDKPQPTTLFFGTLGLNEILFDTFSNFSTSVFYPGIGIGILASLIFGWYFIKKVPKIAQNMYKFGIIALFVMSTMFPWYIIHYIPFFNIIEGIQWLARALPIAILFLSGFGAYLLNWMSNQPNFYKEISRIALIIIIFFNWFGAMSFIFSKSSITNAGLKSEQELNYKIDHKHPIPKANVNFPLENYKVNNNDYYNQFHNEDASGTTDYFPIKTSRNNFFNIMYHDLYYNNKFVSLDNKYLKPSSNALTYNVPIHLKKNQYINLPFIYYNGFNYNVTINNHKIKYWKSINRNTIKFKMPFNTKKPIIHIDYLGSNLEPTFSLISIISWILLIMYIFYIEYKSKQEKKDSNDDK